MVRSTKVVAWTASLPAVMFAVCVTEPFFETRVTVPVVLISVSTIRSTSLINSMSFAVIPVNVPESIPPSVTGVDVENVVMSWNSTLAPAWAVNELTSFAARQRSTFPVASAAS